MCVRAHCSQSPDLQNAEDLNLLKDRGEIQVDDETQNWLTAMEWMKTDSKRSDRDTRISRLSMKRVSSAGASSGVLTDVSSASVDEAQPGRAAYLNPLVRPKLAEGAESRVMHMLEHEALNWEFDVLELDRLTGGHALAALSWSLFERHGLRHTFHLQAAVVNRFLQRLEEGYRYKCSVRLRAGRRRRRRLRARFRASFLQRLEKHKASP